MSKQRPKNDLAFNLIELLVILCVVGILLCICIPWLDRARMRAKSICCNCNLKQIGLGFRTWAIDRTNNFPMSLSTNHGGTREYNLSGDVFPHFQAISNELSTPKVLVCPGDSRQPAADFGTNFANSNLSYFIGIEAQDSFPQMFLSGDRNLTNGSLSTNRVLELTTNVLAGWTEKLHDGLGNVGLADGSVQQLTTLRLREALKWTGVETNRLALP